MNFEPELVLDESHLRHNWQHLSRLSQPSACAAVLKGDAYGVGISRVCHILQNAGCRHFFVNTCEEADELCRAQLNSTIYVLHGGYDLRRWDAPPHVIPVISEVEHLRFLSGMLHQPRSLALHFDTGMNRCGLRFPDRHLQGSLTAGWRDKIELLMTHLHSANWNDAGSSSRQYAALQHIRKQFPSAASSVGASGAVIRHGVRFAGDIARCGIALYGINPTTSDDGKLKSVLEVVARVIAVHDISVGKSVGYRAAFVAQRPSKIAVVGLGYRHGLPVTAGCGVHLTIAGKSMPIVGDVCMDTCFVDVTDADRPIAHGSEAMMVASQPMERVARLCQMSPYQLLVQICSGITHKLPRLSKWRQGRK